MSVAVAANRGHSDRKVSNWRRGVARSEIYAACLGEPCSLRSLWTLANSTQDAKTAALIMEPQFVTIHTLVEMVPRRKAVE